METFPMVYSRHPQFGRYPTEENRLVMSSLCPVCGRDCDDVYLGKLGQELGCNQCITVVSIHDYRMRQLERSGKHNLEDSNFALSSRCPRCEENCKAVYVDNLGQALGCNRCVTAVPIFLYRLQKLEERGENSA